MISSVSEFFASLKVGKIVYFIQNAKYEAIHTTKSKPIYANVSTRWSGRIAQIHTAFVSLAQKNDNHQFFSGSQGVQSLISSPFPLNPKQ
jgi:hypothetical protein